MHYLAHSYDQRFCPGHNTTAAIDETMIDDRVE